MSVWKRCLALTMLAIATTACSLPHPSTAAATQTLPTHSTVGYFDSDGRFSAQQAFAHGYVRKKMGKNADGNWLLQDFYASNGKPQTSVFVLFDRAGLENWDSMPHTDGPLVFYDASGKVSSHATLKRGKLVGIMQNFYADGAVFKDSLYDHANKPLHTTYYRQDGTPIYRVIFDWGDNGSPQFVVYDDHGAAYPSTQLNANIVHQTEAAIADTINQLEAHKAGLAGQARPAPIGIKLPSTLYP